MMNESNRNFQIEINNPEAIAHFEKEEGEITDKYRNDKIFSETVNELENLAKTIGFNGIRVRENGERIEIGFYKAYEADITEDDNTTREEIGIYKDRRDRVIIGEKILRNIKDLFEIDKEFAKNGLTIFIEHEAEHLKNNAGKVLGKMDTEMEETAKIEQIKDYSDLNERMEKINKHYYSPAERQAELQRINSDYKDLDSFVESQAKLYLTDRIIRKGIGVLEDKKLSAELEKLVKQYPGADFIREDLQEKIVKRAEEMRQDLALKRAENFNSEKKTEIQNDRNTNIEASESGIPLVLNKEGEKVESLQFKELIKMVGEQEKAKHIYDEIKKLENEDFKNSKLRDENGELMIVWHGSSRKFENFDPNAKGEWRWRNKKGSHFQSSKEVINQYAEKAKNYWHLIMEDIAKEYYNIKEGVLTPDQKKVVKGIFNEIVEDLIKNGEDSKFYHKCYEDHFDRETKIMERNKRIPAQDTIVYGKRGFATEWALEIFGGEMPTKENCSFSKRFGTYFGNDIGEYKYAAVLDIEKPFREETKEIDYSFELGEKSHREQGTDGTILTHSENLKGMGGLEIPNTKGTYSVAVFDSDKIKIIGVETEKGFELRKEFLKDGNKKE